MSPIVVAGAGAGFGVFLVLRGTLFVPAPLSTLVRRLDRVGLSVAEQRTQPVKGVRHRWMESLGSRLGPATERNLAVLERSPARFALEKVATAIAMLAIGTALSIALHFAGSSVPPGFAALATIALGAIGFAVPDLTLRNQAKARRAGFLHALSSYLDLVNVLLAGGAGTETALEAAAQAGDGWAFEQIRAALLRARTMRQSPWACFTELSTRIGVSELSEIAASVRLAGEQGARIRLSLAARASALRAHQMAHIEAEAQAATERMGLPTVLMFLGFMVLLGYPAMQQIVQGF